MRRNLCRIVVSACQGTHIWKLVIGIVILLLIGLVAKILVLSEAWLGIASCLEAIATQGLIRIWLKGLLRINLLLLVFIPQVHASFLA